MLTWDEMPDILSNDGYTDDKEMQQMSPWSASRFTFEHSCSAGPIIECCSFLFRTNLIILPWPRGLRHV